MDRNLKNITTVTKAASDSAPSGMKTLSPAPGGGLTKNVKGPASVHTVSKAGDLKNSNGVDMGTTTESP